MASAVPRRVVHVTSRRQKRDVAAKDGLHARASDEMLSVKPVQDSDFVAPPALFSPMKPATLDLPLSEASAHPTGNTPRSGSGPLTPHARNEQRGKNPTAGRKAVPDFRAPVGFASNTWNFAAALPDELSSPPGHVGAFARAVPESSGDTPHTAAPGEQFVPLESIPKPSRAVQQPPTPLSARQSFSRWGFSAGAYVGEHQRRPSSGLGLSVKTLQGGGEEEASPQSASTPPRDEQNANSPQKKKRANPWRVLAGVMAANRLYYDMVVKKRERPLINSAETAIREDEEKHPYQPRGAMNDSANVGAPTVPFPTARDSDSAEESDGDTRSPNKPMFTMTNVSSHMDLKALTPGAKKTLTPSVKKAFAGMSGVRQRWRRASVKIRAAKLLTRDSLLVRAIEESHALALATPIQRGKGPSFSLPTPEEQANQLERKHALMDRTPSKQKFMKASYKARNLWKVVSKIVTTVGADAVENPGGGNFAYISVILVAKQKAALLDKVMEERERVLAAAKAGNVQTDLELYSLANVKKRAELSHHPSVVARVFKLWYIANVPALMWAEEHDALPEEGKRLSSAFLMQNATAQPGMTRDQYFALYRRCIKALAPTMEPEDVDDTITDDWQEDSEGRDVLEFKRFHMSIFQLTDTWCEGIDEVEYVTFLESLTNAIAYEAPDGRWVFRDLDDVEPLYPDEATKRKRKKKKGKRGRRGSTTLNGGLGPGFGGQGSSSGRRGSSTSPSHRRGSAAAAARRRSSLAEPLQHLARNAAAQLAEVAGEARADEESKQRPAKNLKPIGDSFYFRLTSGGKSAAAAAAADDAAKQDFLGLLILQEPDVSSAYHGTEVQPSNALPTPAATIVHRPRSASAASPTARHRRGSVSRATMLSSPTARQRRGSVSRATTSKSPTARRRLDRPLTAGPRGSRAKPDEQAPASTTEPAPGANDAGSGDASNQLTELAKAARFETFQSVAPASEAVPPRRKSVSRVQPSEHPMVSVSARAASPNARLTNRGIAESDEVSAWFDSGGADASPTFKPPFVATQVPASLVPEITPGKVRARARPATAGPRVRRRKPKPQAAATSRRPRGPVKTARKHTLKVILPTRRRPTPKPRGLDKLFVRGTSGRAITLGHSASEKTGVLQRYRAQSARKLGTSASSRHVGRGATPSRSSRPTTAPASQPRAHVPPEATPPASRGGPAEPGNCAEPTGAAAMAHGGNQLAGAFQALHVEIGDDGARRDVPHTRSRQLARAGSAKHLKRVPSMGTPIPWLGGEDSVDDLNWGLEVVGWNGQQGSPSPQPSPTPRQRQGSRVAGSQPSLARLRQRLSSRRLVRTVPTNTKSGPLLVQPRGRQ